MKSKKTLVLASLTLALGATFCPQLASADTSTSTATPMAVRKGGDSPVKYMEIITIMIGVVSSLVP